MSHFLEGQRIYLREVTQSDVNDRYYTWMNDPEVNQYLETRYTARSKHNISEFVSDMDGKTSDVFLAICFKDNDLHIGNIKLGLINWVHRYGEISLLIGDKDYWGKGLATEAIRLITEFGFGQLNLRKLKAGCYERNVGSARAFEKVGYVQEGLLKAQWEVKGEFQDQIILGLLRDDYRSDV